MRDGVRERRAPSSRRRATIQRSSVSSTCSSTRRARSGSCRKPLRKPVAQMTCSAPFSSGSTRKRPSRAARSSGSSHSRPGGYEGAEKRRRSCGALGARRGAERGEAALREERPRHVERAPHRLAAADGDDLGAGGERVSPLGRRGHAGADHRDPRRVLVRLVGVDDPRDRPRARPAAASPGCPGASRTWRKVPCPSSAKPSVDGAHALDTLEPEALVPAAARAQLVDVPEELVDGRSVPVADAQQERRQRRAAVRPRARRAPGTSSGSSGRRSRSACAAGGSPPRGRARRPAGSGSSPKTAISPGSRPAVAQRRVGDEAAEPCADDRAPLGHGPT